MHWGALACAFSAALVVASVARAQITVIDDFESYANSAALQAQWVAIPPLLSANVTLDATGISGKSMSIDYDVSAGTNAVEFTFDVDQDYRLRTTIRILYRAVSGSTNEDIVLELRDSADNVLGSGVAPDGTSSGEKRFEVDIVHGFSNLTSVGKVRLAIRDGGDSSGTGTVLFDDITVISGTYSTCRPCHGEFIGKSYVALTDGRTWSPDLHDIHSNMLNFDCKTCHTGSSFIPVFIGSSDGGTGLPGIGCLGCHGREEDLGHDTTAPGRAAGLNQHHYRAGFTECARCHSDTDPADYTPVGENVLPAYYRLPDAAHPDKPTDPCSMSERFVSPTGGLDNDGDLLYELTDPDCQRAAAPRALSIIGLIACLGLLAGFGFWRLRSSKRTRA